jgi:hypothetical protein
LILATALTAQIGFAWAQTATPRLQDADIEAHGGHLSIVRLPIDINGKTVYRDITLDLKVDANGNVSIATDVKQPNPAAPNQVAPTSISPMIVSKPSLPAVAQNFHAGTYRAMDGAVYHVAGHGTPMFGGGLPEWQIAALGSGNHVLDGATWYDGPIDQNPLRRRLRNAGITSQALAWGTSDGGGGVGYDSGSLLGVTAVGSTLTIYSFHKGCCSDTDQAAHAFSLELISPD